MHVLKNETSKFAQNLKMNDYVFFSQHNNLNDDKDSKFNFLIWKYFRAMKYISEHYTVKGFTFKKN